MQYAAHRFQLKVLVDEEDLHVPTITDLYQIADWAEREVYDQFGILFDGHPNLKRLLNHFEFVGHPLRKDYPAQKRQWLSTNDPMIDQLELRLKQNGIAVLDPMPLNTPAVEDLIQGDRL
jgi:NADH-quinone oxidoreductase subunit C